ncbi:efflux RND transporter permease subunit, partial [Candidatus Auribacterota bacterium]
MSLSTFAVKRPVTMMMLYSAFILLGLIALTAIPVELMPDIASKRITVMISMRGGMPPTEIESMVTTKVEDAVGTVSNMEQVLSVAKKSRATISITFKPGTNMDFAGLEVREKFAKVKNKLPSNIEKPVIARYDENDAPVVIMALSSQKYNVEEMRKMVDSFIKEKLLKANGVANINVGGGKEQKILVEMNQERIQAYKLPVKTITSKIGISNLNLLSGEMDQETDKYAIRAMGEFNSVKEIEEVVIKTTPQGSVIRLKDVAIVKDGFADAKSYSRVNNRSVVTLYIQKESSANTISVSKNIARAIEKEIKPKLKQGIRLMIISDQAVFIKEAIDNVTTSLFYGAVLAVIILLIFLKDIKTTFVITASIPTSLVMTFMLMRSCDITLNVMTLSGLALGIGMLLDNSIVVLENIFNKKEKGIEKEEAAIQGSEEIFLEIVASTITTVIVFVPIVFINEKIRLMYQGLALTVTFSLVSSLFVSLSLVPMLSGRIDIKQKVAKSKKSRENKFSKLLKYLPRPQVLYRKTIAFILRYRMLALFAVSILLFISLGLGKMLKVEMMESSERSKFTIFIELPDGAKLDVSDIVVKDIENLLKDKNKYPEIDTVTSKVEGWSSKVYVELVPLAKRTKTTSQVIETLRPILSQVGKAQDTFVYFSGAESSGAKEVMIDVYGFNYDTLKELAYKIAGILGKMDFLVDTKIRTSEGRPQMELKVDRKSAAYFGLTVQDIADSLHCQLRGLKATAYHTEAREIETICRLQEKYRAKLKDLHNVTLVTPTNEQVYLKQIVKFENSLAPSEIYRKNKSRMVGVSSNLGAITMGEAILKIKEKLKEMKFPKDYRYEFGGNYNEMVQSQKELQFALVLTILLVYMVLASLFESYVQPFIIMITVPLAMIGAIFALLWTDNSISMGVMIGAIMLAGIVVNNAIILVESVNAMREKGVNVFRAIIKTGLNRLRPIAMTTMTTVLGLTPMAVGKSESSAMWAPLAITVIGGLLCSTVLTLFIVPAIYL